VSKKKFETDEALQTAWEEYKVCCDNYTVTKHEFSQKLGEFVSAELKCRITYNIKGFCSRYHISRQNFYAHYEKNKKHSDTVTRMREESEQDSRTKFETGELPSSLAGIWMSNYEGYSTKNDVNIGGENVKIKITLKEPENDE